MGYSNHYVRLKNEKSEKKSRNEEKIETGNRIKKKQNKFLDYLHLLKFPKKKNSKKENYKFTKLQLKNSKKIGTKLNQKKGPKSTFPAYLTINLKDSQWIIINNVRIFK